jgi:hypothetical protein
MIITKISTRGPLDVEHLDLHERLIVESVDHVRYLTFKNITTI